MSGRGTPNEHALFMLHQQDIAYKHGPSGTWAQRWIPGVCKHPFIRCTHGDEIIHRGFKRRVCMICGRAIQGHIPRECFFTGRDHPGWQA